MALVSLSTTLATNALVEGQGARVALVFIGLGLVFRDGVAVVVGLLMSGVALVATTGLLLMTWIWGSEWILGWV